MDEDVQAGPDPVNASALDVISCGLGAGVLLFLVLAVVRSQDKESASVDKFIDIEFVVTDNTNALLTPVLYPPGTRRGVHMPIELFDRQTGRFVPNPSDPRGKAEDMKILIDALDPGGTYEPIGFSLIGDIRTTDHAAGIRRFVLHVRNPKAGKWKLSGRYFNNETGATQARLNHAITVQTTVLTRSGKPEIQPPTTIKFAEGTVPIEVEIKD